MKKVLTLNKISPLAQQALGDNYLLAEDIKDPDCILVRSFKMHDYTLAPSVQLVARCGAGVNNIPLDTYADQGVIVYNTPGANGNAVKELAICSLFLCGRKIIPAFNWASKLRDDDTTVVEQVEKGKAQFVGNEIMGKTLGLIGLGAIGKKVARAAIALGMRVVFTEVRDVSGDKDLPSEAKQVQQPELLAQADFISLHLPLLPSTRGIINADVIAQMKDGVNIINTARGELVNDDAIIEAVNSGKVNRYVTDFANSRLLNVDNIIALPHIGASTPEAEENCATIAGEQIVEFYDNLNIVNSVNFPSISMPTKGYAVLVLFKGQGELFAQEGKSWKLHDYMIKSNGKYGVAKFDFQDKVDLALFDNIPHLRIFTK
ncbi:MAG: 3-phosphoglycerate dehydrogenase [Clostridia bacterium]|nr:3-phosphoglycerate dehydrogenase [Clostridia bacterium]